ncbi:MAG TPA: vitamin B12-dependent ribonucleotide reductase [Bacillota bacterium]|nr:vitamin B12-dependent ribonucleotide reductase [Bacillota bacterium]
MKSGLSLPEPELSYNALTVLESRYLSKDESGKVIETPREMFWRVAKNIALMDVLYDPLHETESSASEEVASLPVPEFSRWDWAALKNGFSDLESRGLIEGKWEDIETRVRENMPQLARTAVRFYMLMAEGKFLPNSPALSNAGRELQQLCACFVLPIEDSMVSIFETLKNAALIHKSGGGTGFSFSRLRPKNDVVKTTGGVASGPISFMKVFNAATEAIKQGGVRRGANMGMLRVDHPDILEFITLKNDTTQLTNFNISVAITEKFMDALEEDGEYELVNPRSKEVVGKLRARDVFDLIVESAWRTGEPGIVFIDRLNEFNPTPNVGTYEATNPCGEQMLLPYEACNLGSLNVAKFVREVNGSPRVDWEGLRESIHVAVHFMDNMIDAGRYPLPEIEAMHKGNRKVGLGLMGWADLLIQLGILYDSEDAVDLAEDLIGFIQAESRAASLELAKTRGVFPNWKGSRREAEGLRVRNATTTTIAPTGTISIIAGASSGIEPLFSLAFTRHVLDGTELREVNPAFRAYGKKLGFYSDDLMDEVARRGALTDVEGVPEEVKRIFVTAHEIEPEWHIRMQAAFQKYTDNAVSKTVNFPNEATSDDVERVFRLAYDLGCKGVTVYRDGSRKEQVLTVGTEPDFGKSEAAPDSACPQPAANMHYRINGVWGKIRPINRPSRLEGFTDVRATPLGKLFITLNTIDRHPIELFAQIGKAGSDVSAFTEAIARLISISLRSGVDPQEIANQLTGIGGSRSIGFGPGRVRSVPDAIGQFLAGYLSERFGEEDAGCAEEGTSLFEEDSVSAKLFSLCPSCGTWNLIHVEGCLKCVACGYTEC